MKNDRDDLFESLQAIAARRPEILHDPIAEQAFDDAVAAARPRTHAHMRALLEIPDENAWEALLREELSPGLATIGATIDFLARTRAECEALAQSGESFEESVAREFADAVTSGGEPDSEVLQVAEAMLDDGSFKKRDVEGAAAYIEHVTAVAISALREHGLGTARRRELALRLTSASAQLLLS